MPTLEELFKSKKYDTLGNKTPEEAFAIRNSKDIPVVSTSFALNKTADPLINKARKNNGIRIGETRLEEENVGLYAYTNLGQPAIYGTDILRLSSQSTPLLEAMKAGTGGRGLSFTAAKIVGDTVGEAVKFGGSKALGVPATFQPKALLASAGGAIRNSIGSLIPDVLIPSKIVTNPIFSVKVPGVSEEYRTHEILSNLKALSAGTKLATFVARNATGTPDQIKNTLVNQGLNIAQQETKKLVARGVSNLLSKGGEKAQQLARELSLTNSTYVRYSSLKKYSEIVGGEKTFGINDGVPNNKETQNADNDLAKRGLDLSVKYFAEYSGELDAKKRGKKKFAKEMWASSYVESNPDENQSLKYSKSTKPITGKNTRKDWSFKNDPINSSLEVGDEGTKTSENKRIEDSIDFIPLKFISVANNTSVQFRATLTGLSEQFSPSWDSSRFIGSPFNFYNYQSIERSVQFTFKAFALNADEHKHNWNKLGYLASLCYPQRYETATGAVTAPFLKFTMGDMYRNKECFIENMTYNIDDDYPWEVGLNYNLSNYRLPMIVEVTMTLKFVEHKSNTYTFTTGSDGKQDYTKVGVNMYGYKPSQEDKAKEGAVVQNEQFRSTNNRYQTMPKDIQQLPQETQVKNSTVAWPQDDTAEAEAFRKENKLKPINIIAYYPPGSNIPRKVYQQKKTGYLYFSDGTPYTGFPKNTGPSLKEESFKGVSDRVENPLTKGSIPA